MENVEGALDGIAQVALNHHQVVMKRENLNAIISKSFSEVLTRYLKNNLNLRVISNEDIKFFTN